MTFPDLSSVNLDLLGYWYVALVGIFVPIAAVIQARTTPPTRSRQKVKQRLKNSLMTIAFTFLALYVAREEWISVYRRPALNITNVLASLGTLVAALVIAELLLTTRTPEQRRRLWVNQIIPRNREERAVWIFSSTVAGVCEEIVYRGVLFILIAAITGSVVVGALASAVSFALAHAKQGRKSVIFIGAVALVFQGLVIVSASLWPAMAVHSLYNIIRGFRASRALEDLNRLPA